MLVLGQGILRLHWRLKAALAASTILVSGFAAPAFGQTAPEIPAPPTRYSVDQNGVDMTRGAVIVSDPKVTIGGQHGMSFGRYSLGGGWTTDIRYSVHKFTASSTRLIVVIGGRSVYFDPSGGGYTNVQGSGETLALASGVYTLTLSDGTIVSMSNAPFNQSADKFQYFLGLTLGVATTLTRPSGEINTFSYAQTNICGGGRAGICRGILRPTLVTSNFGYALQFSYSGTTWESLSAVTAVNMAVDTCNTATGTCTITNPDWPKLNFGSTLSGTNTVYSASDNLGRTSTSTFDSSNRPIAVRRPSSATDNMTVAYDANGRVSSITRDGATWTYVFSLSGTIMTATVTNPDSTQRVVVSDTTVGLPTSVRDELNRTTTYTYDTNGRLSTASFPEGNGAQYGYDLRGNLTQTTIVAKPGSGLANLTLGAAYLPTCTNVIVCNKPTSTTDAKGNVTDYTYDPVHGGISSVMAPAATAGGVRPQTRFGYSQAQAFYKNSSGSIVASGQPIYLLTAASACQTTASCAGAADEVKTTTGYGPQVAGIGNNLLPVSVSSGSGDGVLTATTAATYDSVGNRLTVDGPLAGTADTTRTRYDAARQVVGIVGPDPDGAGALKSRAQRLTYNLDGQVTNTEIGNVNSQSDADWAAMTVSQNVAVTYDANARAVKQQLQASGTTYALSQTSYDALGRVDCQATRMDPAQWASQTVACMPQTTGPNGPDRITKTIYDAAGKVTQVQTAVGTADASNEVTTTYNANGTAATVKDGENNLTTYEYDGFDRLVKTRYPSTTQGSGTSSTTDYEQLTLDANGNVTQRRLRDGQLIGFTYDNLNRQTFMDLSGVGIDKDISFGYDLLGRLTTSSDAVGHLTNIAYDALGRPYAEATTYGGTKLSQYDLAGRRTRLTWPDGFYVTYDYDVTGNVTAIRENGAASGVGVLGTYAYDNLGRRTTLTRGNGTVTSYSFDPVSRLSSLTQDLVGTTSDLTINGFTYNPASQIGALARSNDSYAWGGHYNVNRNYAVNGLNQMTAAGAASLGYDGRGNLTSSGSSTYGYSQRNLLASHPQGQLFYDSLGRLDLSYLSSGSGTAFDYDGSNLATEYSYPTGTLLRRYVNGPGEDEPLVWYEGSGTTDRRWLHADERGSVVAVSNASGTAIAINSYDEYGIPASTNMGRFQYTGQAWLPELGMYYYKARIYSPTLGRFMQTDPIGYADGMNIYNYVGSDPVNFTDPSGLAEIIVTAPNSPLPFGSFRSNIAPPIPGVSEETREEAAERAAKRAGFSDEIIVTAMKPKPKNPVQPPRIMLPQGTAEERRRAACAAPSNTPVLSAISDISEFVATGADTVATIAVFVPGGQGVAGAAKLVSLGAQGIEAGSNYAIGRYTGNYSRLQAQGASFVTGQVVGRSVSAGTALLTRGTTTLSRGAASRLGGLGDSAGAVFGDGAADAYCGK